jgi:hypothetical protein
MVRTDPPHTCIYFTSPFRTSTMHHLSHQQHWSSSLSLRSMVLSSPWWLSLFIVLQCSTLATASTRLPIFRSTAELPADAKDAEWMSLADGQGEFLRLADRRLESTYDQSFVDGSTNYYDPYAQAWRLLGLYIDCNALQGDDHDSGDGCQRYLLWAAVRGLERGDSCCIGIASVTYIYLLLL